MVVTEEIKNRIIQHNVVSLDNMFHGYIIILDGNKVWQHDNGCFIFDSRKQAMTAFYNCMKWKCAREAGQMGENGYRYYDTSRETWMSFKRAAHFEVRYI